MKTHEKSLGRQSPVRCSMGSEVYTQEWKWLLSPLKARLEQLLSYLYHPGVTAYPRLLS